MKKLIAILMTLMVMLTGAAYADMTFEAVTLEEPPVNASDRMFLIEFVEPDSSLSYALVGTGSGADAFESFGIDMDDYEEGYKRIWQFLTMMEPAVTVVGSPNLSFSPDAKALYTEISMNGEIVAQAAGLNVFAVISEGAANLVPEIDDKCSVTIWNSEGIVTYPMHAGNGNLCPNCGRFDDGSDEHDTVINRYCEEGHTECMGNPEHHCEDCGHDYECSKSGSHTDCAECKQPWCYKEKGDHKELDCGHRGCQVFGKEADHAKCAGCSGYLCDGKDHNHVPAPETETEFGGAPSFGE